MSSIAKYNGTSAYTLKPLNIDTRKMNGVYTPNQIIQTGLYNSYDPANPSCYAGTGTNVRDLTGNRDVTLYGLMESGYAQNGWFVMDGVNDYGQGTTSITINGNALSIGVWFQLASQPVTFTEIFSVSNISGFGVRIARNSSNGNLAFRVSDGVVGRNYNTNGNAYFSYNKWYYICGTYNFSSGSGTIYVFDDTGLRDSNTASHATYADFTSNPVTDAVVKYGGNSLIMVDGTIGEAHYYNNYRMTQTDWERNYNNTKARYGY